MEVMRYSAACPGCGNEAEWTQTATSNFDPTANAQSITHHYDIACEMCPPVRIGAAA